MTSAMPISELDDLLSLLVDGLIDDQGSARLQDVLRADSAARRRYRRFLAVHSALRWDYAAVARDQRAAPSTDLATQRRWWLPASGVAAALLAAIALGWWSHMSTTAALCTTLDVSGGSLTWSDGAHRIVCSGGESLNAGHLVLEGASASASLRFTDGSTVTMAGDSDVSISDNGQKQLHLAFGVLSAEVQPQPPGHPLLVYTGTAELEVVGTRFTVTANAAQTALDVEHGRVRFERLADGQRVEVAAQQSAVASLDVAHALRTSLRERPGTSWTLDLEHQPAPICIGTWSAPTSESPGLMHAAPYLAGRNAQGAPVIHHGVRIYGTDDPERPFVRFVAGSVLTMRFRVARPDGKTHIDVMVCTHTGTGGFGGTFTANVQPELLPPDAHGWRTVTLNVADFVRVRPDQRSLVDRDAVFILPRSFNAAAGLDVASLSVASP